MKELKTDIKNPLDLKPHPDNPRGEIPVDSEEIRQLAEDISKRGIIQPIVITPDNFILAGHRRRVASILAGLESVPVVYRELKTDEFAEDFFLAENMQRQDLSPLEEARAIERLRHKLEELTGKSVTNNELVRRLNLSVSLVRERLAILELPERVQKLFHLSEIPLNSASKLLKLKDYPEEIEKFADRMATRQVTLSSLDALITRRLPQLENAEQKTVKRVNHFGNHFPEGTQTQPISRKSVLEKLGADSSRRISLHTVRAVLEQTCCHCGMIGNDDVCETCPLPKFISGVIGRSDAAEDNYA
jgi:ParB family transcriptional regulator, chromosome partitioning protein